MANSAVELSKSLNLLDIVYFIHKAWEQVSAQTVKNCFRKAGFRINDMSSDDSCWTAEDELPHSALAQFSNVINRVQSQIQVDVEDYISLDNDIVINDEDVEHISTEMLIASQESLANSSEDELESEIEIEDKLTSSKEAYLAIKKLKAFSLNRSDIESIKMLTDLQMHLQDIEVKGKTRQAEISDFFKSS